MLCIILRSLRAAELSRLRGAGHYLNEPPGSLDGTRCSEPPHSFPAVPSAVRSPPLCRRRTPTTERERERVAPPWRRPSPRLLLLRLVRYIARLLSLSRSEAAALSLSSSLFCVNNPRLCRRRYTAGKATPAPTPFLPSYRALSRARTRSSRSYNVYIYIYMHSLRLRCVLYIARCTLYLPGSVRAEIFTIFHLDYTAAQRAMFLSTSRRSSYVNNLIRRQRLYLLIISILPLYIHTYRHIF